jgi:hypothetical protein
VLVVVAVLVVVQALQVRQAREGHREALHQSP